VDSSQGRRRNRTPYLDLSGMRRYDASPTGTPLCVPGLRNRDHLGLDSAGAQKIFKIVLDKVSKVW